MKVVASVIVCDDVRAEASGKLIAIGIFTTDIAIFSDEHTAPQLQFLFYAECETNDPFKSIRFEVTLPGEQPVFSEIQKLPPPPPVPGRSRAFMRQIITIAPAALRPGKIIAKVIHERGEIPLSAGWVTKIPANAQTPNSTTVSRPPS
jgi:hypothetical protein